MRLPFTICFIALFVCTVKAQKIKRSVISSFASAYESGGDGVMIASTGGQPSNTTLFSSGKSELRQGFQQPPVFQASDKLEVDIRYRLYPNPANQGFTIILQGEEALYRLRVFDSKGRLLMVENVASRTPVQISSKSFSSGAYFLTVSNSFQRLATEQLIIQH